MEEEHSGAVADVDDVEAGAIGGDVPMRPRARRPDGRVIHWSLTTLSVSIAFLRA